METKLEFTGERMVPQGADSNTFWEHVYRYRMACTMAQGRAILDIACGEGYGSAALIQSGAHSLTGVDISTEAVEHAKRAYGINAIVGNAEAIPLPDNSVDFIVSFETIEHVPNPEVFLKECLRVIRADGLVLISTPNLDIYRETSPSNPFHCSEMAAAEFKVLMSTYFGAVEYFGQTSPPPIWASIRGGGRLTRLGQRIFNPTYSSNLTDEIRRDAVNLCMQRDSRLGQYFTPLTVRKMNQANLERCQYIVAKATHPRKLPKQ